MCRSITRTSRLAGASHQPARLDRVTTLYEWAGGEDAFTRLIDAFYDRVEADDRGADAAVRALKPGTLVRR
jgi:hypothetical protein